MREYFLEPSLPTVAELSYGYVGDNKNEFVKRVSNKAKKAAIQIINLLEKKPNSPAINVIRYQLIKSATSTSANYRAVRVSRSNKEFYAKICVVVEECAETIQWLEVLIEADVNVDKAGLKEILPEWIELMRIFSSAKHTMRTKLH